MNDRYTVHAGFNGHVATVQVHDGDIDVSFGPYPRGFTLEEAELLVEYLATQGDKATVCPMRTH